MHISNFRLYLDLWSNAMFYSNIFIPIFIYANIFPATLPFSGHEIIYYLESSSIDNIFQSEYIRNSYHAVAWRPIDNYAIALEAISLFGDAEGEKVTSFQTQMIIWRTKKWCVGVRYGSIKKLTMTATTRRDETVEKYLHEEKGTLSRRTRYKSDFLRLRSFDVTSHPNFENKFSASGY